MRRRNAIPDVLRAFAPAGIMAGAELVKARIARKRVPVAVPGFHTVREWDKRFGGAKLGTITVPYDALVSVFGDPVKTKDRGIDIEWWPEITWYVVFDDGNTAMIYDWQLTVPVEQNSIWRVAGSNPVLDYVAAALSLGTKDVQDARIEFRAHNQRAINKRRARRLMR